MAKALMFLTNGGQKKAFRSICSTLQVECVPVTPADFDRPVAALCGISLFPGATAPSVPGAMVKALPGEALLFCGFSEALLDRMLEACRAAGLTAPLKAVVTPINGAWSFRMLASELARERAALQR